MTSPLFRPRIDLVIEARQALDRRGAVAVMAEDLANGPPTGEFWEGVSQIASQLGELGLATEAAKRYAATAPKDVDHVLFFAHVLLQGQRIDEALHQIQNLPAALRQHPAVLHFRTLAATQKGDFAEAEALARQAIAISPAPIQWLGLSIAKTFVANDPDILAMEAILPRVARAPADIRAQLFYALGKAYDDVGDMEKAASVYAQGAALMRSAVPAPDGQMWNEFVAHLISGYTKENMAKFKPSTVQDDRVIFVTGFPRSGTTLVEHILASHSEVCGGAELNLLPVAMIPASFMPGDGSDNLPQDANAYLSAGDFIFDDALAYQNRSASLDPWGDLAKDYLHMVTEHFGSDGHVVDKTLNLGSFMGLLLHILPKAKVIWLRRKPEDCALSIFRVYAPLGSMPWTYSMSDIAAFFRAEDQLYAHWTKMFPDRILTVPYEELVSEPTDWIKRIMAFTGLPEEPQVFEPHKSTRAVATASMAQVRSPISTARIGASEKYKAFVEEFRAAYYK